MEYFLSLENSSVSSDFNPPLHLVSVEKNRYFACFDVNLTFLDHADKIHTKPQYAILALVENYVTGMS